MRSRRRLLILTLLFVAPSRALLAQNLQPYLQADRVHVTAPQVQFLAGRVLERLRNGAAVPFSFQLTATAGGKTVAQSSGRVVLSFDLWEERFSGVQDAPRRTASHLTSNAAESWSLEGVSLPLSALAGQKPFVLKLEIRAEEQVEQPDAEAGNPGLSMAGLIEVFSRKSQGTTVALVHRIGAAARRGLEPEKPQGARQERGVAATQVTRPNDVNRLRNRLILVFLAGTLVPLGAMLWITVSLLQQSLRYADTGDLDRLVQTAGTNRTPALPGCTRRSEGGGCERDNHPAAYPEIGLRLLARGGPGVLGQRRTGEVFALGQRGGPDRLPGAPRRGGSALHAAAGQDPDGAFVGSIPAGPSTGGGSPAKRPAKGFYLHAACFERVGLDSLTHRADVCGSPDQPSDPGLGGGPVGAGGRALRNPGPRATVGRSRSGGPGLQRHGCAARAESRPAGVPDPGRQLAAAGPKNGARVEELTDPHSAHRRRDRRPAAALRRRLPAAGGPGRDRRDRDPRAARAGFFRVLQRARSPACARRRERSRHGTGRVPQGGASRDRLLRRACGHRSQSVRGSGPRRRVY